MALLAKGLELESELTTTSLAKERPSFFRSWIASGGGNARHLRSFQFFPPDQTQDPSAALK